MRMTNSDHFQQSLDFYSHSRICLLASTPELKEITRTSPSTLLLLFLATLIDFTLLLSRVSKEAPTKSKKLSSPLTHRLMMSATSVARSGGFNGTWD
ncbi:Uncharacterized protein HZ326_22611 [Fusarium oxysporum f. sp. albedinis]|nr:Uncharacterized protein HZ326_22611 [Fusarium oxysporum f. sp. albedinis]